MADLEIQCPHCDQGLEASEDLLGQTVECPACGKPIQLPDSVDDAPSGSQCPSCQETMAPDAVLCVLCGYHRLLGRRIGTDLH
jgi:ssDNA-binding Zn-finger/Zn-ribbon topoisomerase 1